MTTMLEKAAYAAFVNANKAKPERSAREIAAFWTAMDPARKAEWIDAARATLMAIREPDETALRAAESAFHEEHAPADGASDEAITAGIRAYIDAILAEKPEASPT